MATDRVDYRDKDGPHSSVLRIETDVDPLVRFEIRQPSGEELITDLNREAVLSIIDQLDDWVARTTPPWTRHNQ